MKNKTKRKIVLAVLLSILLIATVIFITCQIDHGLGPIHSKIGGRVYLQGNLPPHTDEIRIAAALTFPPRNINELLFSDMLQFKSGNTITNPAPEWEIYLPEGTYGVVAAIWKGDNQSWNISDVVGVYGATFVGNVLAGYPQPVTIQHENHVLDTIDIAANLNRVNRDATIKGKITFLGKWPENTGITGVGAFFDIPEPNDPFDYFYKNAALDYGVKTFTEEYDYMLRVNSSDTLKYIAVLWIDDSFDLNQIHDIGFYPDPENPEIPGIVVVEPNSSASNINITVDFSATGGSPIQNVRGKM
jgi:hypothetical protein